MIWKFDLAVILVVVSSATVVLERSHRVVIDAPAATDPISLAAAAGCPDNDTMPYGEKCVAFLKVPAKPGGHRQVVLLRAQPEPCPDTDRGPYSASCIAFLKGATEAGMQWRATAGPPAL